MKVSPWFDVTGNYTCSVVVFSGMTVAEDTKSLAFGGSFLTKDALKEAEHKAIQTATVGMALALVSGSQVKGGAKKLLEECGWHEVFSAASPYHLPNHIHVFCKDLNPVRVQVVAQQKKELEKQRKAIY